MTPGAVAAPARPTLLDTDATPPAASWGGAWLRRPVVACLLLFLVYAALSTLNDPHAFLGTDTGGKVATLRAMDARGDLDPDLGYWAERFDPDGVAHPIALNFRIGDRYVNLTTFPMPYASMPLYELAGLRGILLLPMLGGVATAAAARALSRRLGGRGDLAFWTIGLATPVVVYALDFWEHTLGLALMAWGTVLLLDLARGNAGAWAAVGAGALFGAAATMRTEAFVYMLVAGVVVGAAVLRRVALSLLRIVPAAAVGTVVPLALNQLFERVVLGAALRSDRAASAARAGSSGVGTRVDDALTTFVGLNNYHTPTDWVFGALTVAVLAVAVFFAFDASRRRLAPVLVAIAALLWLVPLSDGLGFLPGLLTASPLAVVGICVAGRDRAFRIPAAIALGSLPLVWAFQYSGGANPQWGGRYVLLSGFLLAVIGATMLERVPRAVTTACVALAVFVTLAGVRWLEVRSNQVADGMGTIVATKDVVVVRGLPHLLREAGASYSPTRRWLTAETDDELPDALDVVAATGDERFRLVGRRAAQTPRELDGWTRVSRRDVRLVGDISLSVAEYRVT